MKKITLFVCALAVSMTAFAAPFKKAVKSPKAPVIKEVVATFDANSAQKKVAAADTIQVPYRSHQTTFRVGKPSQGFGYDFYQQGLVSAFTDSILFYNDSLYNADWFLGEEQIATGTPLVQLPVHFGDNDLPLMKIDGGDDILIYDWQVARTYLANYWEGYEAYFYTSVNVAPAEYMPITQCARYTEDVRESPYGNDLYRVGAGQYGSYCYGTKLTNPWQGSTTMDSMIVVFENEGVMNIDHITAGVYTNATSIAGMFPGEGDHVRLTVFPGGFNEEGRIVVDWENPIATATANGDNFTPSTDEDGNPQTYGMLEWDFLEEDPVTGAETPAPIVVSGSFVVLLDEYNDGTANFGIYSDYFGNGTSCRTYFPWYDYSEGTSYISSVWGNNILLNVVAYFPVFEAPEVVSFKQGESLEQVFEVASNLWDEDIVIDAPEWITVTVETDYTVEGEGEDASYTHNFINKLTIAVEESTETREGTIELDGMGLPVSILVKQNDTPTGIENVNFKNNGKSYNVLGVEVGEDFEGIIIRNGEKFIR